MSKVLLFEISYEQRSWKPLEKQIFEDYLAEKREARKNNLNPIPLHLYSKRVYRAYKNAWKLIDRRLLTEQEINIMKFLGIYKPIRVD